MSLPLPVEPLSDAEWVQRLQAGDEAATHLLWELVFRFAYHAAFKLGQPEDLARDAATQALERLLVRGGLNRYGFRAAFKTYCYQIVAREVLRLIPRQMATDQRQAVLDEQLPASAEPITENLDLAACLAQLPPREQEILYLCYALELPPEAVAKRMGLERNHVNQLAYRARKKLRVCLEGR